VPEDLTAEADGDIADSALDGTVIRKIRKAALMQERVNMWWQSCGSLIQRW